MCSFSKVLGLTISRLSALIFLVSSLFISLHCVAEQLYLFDIEKQSADKAIIAFAKKINKTIIFSYKLTKDKQANKLSGYHNVDTGLYRLLNNSGIVAIIDRQGQISIQSDTAVKYKTNINATNTSLSVEANNIIDEHDASLIAAGSEVLVEKIVIVGSRVAIRSLQDLPVAVDVLTVDALVNTGQTDLARMLQTLAPSFNYPSSSISDGTDALLPATLRGLGPDQTLVLINGKRRHQASLIHINTSVGRGTTGTDINAIPISGIKQIEVLRDGAAAQYGSDAIAGVINIVLKDDDKGGDLRVSYGENYLGDGQTTDIHFNKGLSFAQQGYLNGSVNLRQRRYTDRSGLHGACQYSGCRSLVTSENSFVSDNTRELNANRQTFRIGDADTEQLAFAVNGGYQFDSSKVFGFMTYSERNNQSATFFRDNSNKSNITLSDQQSVYPDGFLPMIMSDIDDFAINLGYQLHLIRDRTFEISYTYGNNTIDYVNSNTLNSSFANKLNNTSNITADDVRQNIPRSASAYGLALSLQTINADFTQLFDHSSLAMGFEWRRDHYQVKPGEKYAYFDYDSINNSPLFTDDYAGGTQGFPGISPFSAVNEFRDVNSVYAEVDFNFSDDTLISSALRYDNYQDFGASANLKLATNITINSMLALRGSLSTGFRAPSMQQLYFNNISTQFLPDPSDENADQIAVQVGTFRNDSSLADSIGIPTLKEEKSTNISLGGVLKPNDSLNITIDYYAIDIDDRIVISNKLVEGLSPALDTILQGAGAGAGQFFLNGADTQTRGLDVIASWQTLALAGDLTLTLAANITDTKVTDLFTPPGSRLNDIAPEEVFSRQDISIIEQWQPQDRLYFGALFKKDNLTINLSFNRFGKYTILDLQKQTYSAELLTDLRLQYQWSKTVSVYMGGNNIFDVYPDKNNIGNSRGGTILDLQGNEVVSSPGVFTYSRRSAPFGFNGGYYYAGINFSF